MGRAMRRTIMRYLCLSLTMVFRKLSNKVAQRFPLMSDLIAVGLITQSELDIIEAMEIKYPGSAKNWMPIVWAAAIVTRARSEGRIRDDFAKSTLMDSLNSFRSKCGTLMQYNFVNIPLVYTQVVGIAVFYYFIVRLLSQQSIQFIWFPVLIVMEFIFYVGWYKVALSMLNPFGDDDDDFEVNKYIDQNIQIAYLIVDEMHNDHPELLKGKQGWQMNENSSNFRLRSRRSLLGRNFTYQGRQKER
jgi:bestrophin, other